MVGSWPLEVWPIPIRHRKARNGCISIRHMVVGVIALVEVSSARIGIEKRSRGLVVVGTLMSIPLTLTTITHGLHTFGIIPITIIVHDRRPFLVAIPIVYSCHI